VNPIEVRTAAGHDTESLLKMPPYSGGGLTFPFREEILVAEDKGAVVGAVSVGDKEISPVYGEWNEEFERCLNKFEKVTSRMISRLYVLPAYRYRGIGTKLVEEAVRHVNEKGFNEVYAGIYIGNNFRDISQHIFEKNGFAKIGSCICFLSKGYCRGTLLKRTISLSNLEKRK
jgi:GNAT superfamily N-acetyltransferase